MSSGNQRNGHGTDFGRSGSAALTSGGGELPMVGATTGGAAPALLGGMAGTGTDNAGGDENGVAAGVAESAGRLIELSGTVRLALMCGAPVSCRPLKATRHAA